MAGVLLLVLQQSISLTKVGIEKRWEAIDTFFD